MKPCYQFKPWSRLKGDAQKVGEALEKLRNEAGALSPQRIVEAARPAQSPLHSYFDWNDTTAAEKYREQQAAHLLRSIVVTKAPGVDLKAPTRAFVSVRQVADDHDAEEDEPPATYTSISEAVRVVDYREQLINDALRDLDAYRIKYQLLSDLTGWGRAITAAREELQRLVDAQQKEPA